jgi:hypothetical protein
MIITSNVVEPNPKLLLSDNKNLYAAIYRPAPRPVVTLYASKHYGNMLLINKEHSHKYRELLASSEYWVLNKAGEFVSDGNCEDNIESVVNFSLLHDSCYTGSKFRVFLDTEGKITKTKLLEHVE